MIITLDRHGAWFSPATSIYELMVKSKFNRMHRRGTLVWLDVRSLPAVWPASQRGVRLTCSSC
jgi:hypothetical protein